ncbi:hypothetical protein [Flagellimonas allohymeniacidonis]|uniref:Lipoprotein n=1 Tax=Flagellimonas allohymeniacidonis TaxID=2517819 RepID=A0A4Q8QK45_9FLAO|nr:hypothetical protein [Allomuricauda hymeniacidonis]TAI48879.1 hypothetical protein EW142_03520 [Allomuricauda hymeniacidonis]
MKKLIYLFVLGFALTAMVSCSVESVGETESLQTFDEGVEANTRNNQWSNRSHSTASGGSSSRPNSMRSSVSGQSPMTSGSSGSGASGGSGRPMSAYSNASHGRPLTGIDMESTEATGNQMRPRTGMFGK